MDVKLDRKEFEAWLEEQPSNRPIGRAADCLGCPIHKFLKSKGLLVEVYSNSLFSVDSEQFLGEPPEWASLFIDLIDQLPARGDVYPDQAFDILASI